MNISADYYAKFETASCGGKENIPQSSQSCAKMLNKLMNNIPFTTQDVRMLEFVSEGLAWMKSHPNFIQALPAAKDLFAGITSNTIKHQYDSVQAWMSTDWSGVCDELTRVSSPTLIITGTDDNTVPSANSL